MNTARMHRGHTRGFFIEALSGDVATALPNFLTYEYMQSNWAKDQPNPLRHDLVHEPIEVDRHLKPSFQ
jgi:hypothetical protein